MIYNIMNNYDQIIQMNEDGARIKLENIIWPNGIMCSKCNSKRITKLNNSSYKNRKKREGLYKCKTCDKQFTVTSNSIFSGTHMSMKQLLIALYLINNKPNLTILNLSKILDVGYKSSFNIYHKIKNAENIKLYG